MAVYLIEGDKVAPHSKAPDPLPEGAIAVRSLKALKASALTGPQLVAIWNGLPGHTPIAKFKSRDVAVQRLWTAFQQLALEGQAKAPKEDSGTGKARPTSSKPEQKKAAEKRTARATRPDSKQARVIALLRRPKGATIAELVEATGWQQHSVRGVLSGALKKRLGLMIESRQEPRGRVYRITGAEPQA